MLIEVRVSGSLPHQVFFLFGTHIVPTIRTGGEHSVITSAASIPTQCYKNIGKCIADGRVKCFSLSSQLLLNLNIAKGTTDPGLDYFNQFGNFKKQASNGTLSQTSEWYT